jgi:hypothetical protein
MQDEFDDSELAMPDDDVAGGDLNDLGVGTEGDLDFGLDEDEADELPAGRPSGGARAAVRREPVVAPVRPASRSARPASVPKKAKKKAAPKRKKAAPKKKARAAKKAAPKKAKKGKPAKKAARAKKGGKKAARKAGRKRR